MPTTDELQVEIDALMEQVDDLNSSVVSINQVVALLKTLKNDIIDIVIDRCTSQMQIQINEIQSQLIFLQATLGNPTDDPTDQYEFAKTYDHRVLTYDGNGDLDELKYYEDAAKTELAFTKNFFYSMSGDLLSTVLTRASDSALFNQVFTYDGNGDLTDIDYS